MISVKDRSTDVPNCGYADATMVRLILAVWVVEYLDVVRCLAGECAAITAKETRMGQCDAF